MVDGGEEEEVIGTDHCLIKKGYSLECEPEEIASGKIFNNIISEDVKKSEGKVLDQSN